MSKRMVFYTAGRPYTLDMVEDQTAVDLAKAIKRSWESGNTVTFDCQMTSGVHLQMKSDAIEALTMEDIA